MKVSSHSINNRILLLSFSILFFLGINSCSSGPDKGSESNDSSEQEKVENSSEDNKSLAGFPSEVPIYEHSKLSSTTTSGGFTIYAFTTSDNASKIMDFYTSKINKNTGWSVDKDISNEKVLVASKGDFYITVRITETDYVTIISITVPEE